MLVQWSSNLVFLLFATWGVIWYFDFATILVPMTAPHVLVKWLLKILVHLIFSCILNFRLFATTLNINSKNVINHEKSNRHKLYTTLLLFFKINSQLSFYTWTISFIWRCDKMQKERFLRPWTATLILYPITLSIWQL